MNDQLQEMTEELAMYQASGLTVQKLLKHIERWIKSNVYY